MFSLSLSQYYTIGIYLQKKTKIINKLLNCRKVFTQNLKNKEIKFQKALKYTGNLYLVELQFNPDFNIRGRNVILINILLFVI